MRRRARIATFTFVLTLAMACGQQEPHPAASPAAPAAAAAPAQLTPEQLGELGAQLARNPDRADQLLAQHQLTRESFEKAVRDVTEDLEASKRYTAAYKRAGA